MMTNEKWKERLLKTGITILEFPSILNSASKVKIECPLCKQTESIPVRNLVYEGFRRVCKQCGRRTKLPSVPVKTREHRKHRPKPKTDEDIGLLKAVLDQLPIPQLKKPHLFNPRLLINTTIVLDSDFWVVVDYNFKRNVFICYRNEALRELSINDLSPTFRCVIDSEYRESFLNAKIDSRNYSTMDGCDRRINRVSKVHRSDFEK